MDGTARVEWEVLGGEGVGGEEEEEEECGVEEEEELRGRRE